MQVREIQATFKMLEKGGVREINYGSRNGEKKLLCYVRDNETDGSVVSKLDTEPKFFMANFPRVFGFPISQMNLATSWMYANQIDPIKNNERLQNTRQRKSLVQIGELMN